MLALFGAVSWGGGVELQSGVNSWIKAITKKGVLKMS